LTYSSIGLDWHAACDEKMHGDALAAGSAMIADGLERSVRLAAAAALLAFFARHRGKSPRESQIDRTTRPDPHCDEESREASENNRRHQPWADLLWSFVILLLLTVVVYTALHGADVLAELDDLGLVPGAY
jgi:predicted nucleic acid-binding Zn ribbon protein